VSEKEICALIERYDRKRDGLITYSEFTHELTPKTSTPSKTVSPNRK
jgi:Ca2+-binding EF-hand superfamily protein